MGIFGYSSPGQPGHTRNAPEERRLPGVTLPEPCDKCQVAWAQVEVRTAAGPVFLCQHHHREYRASIIAAGHQIRTRFDNRSSV